MQFYDINKIPRLVSDGKMTISEGASMIENIVRSNPYYFGLNNLSKSIYQSTLDSLSENLQNILKVFNPSTSTSSFLVSFTLYIHYLVRQQKHIFLSSQHVHTVFDDEDDPYGTPLRGYRFNLSKRKKRYSSVRRHHTR